MNIFVDYEYFVNCKNTCKIFNFVSEQKLFEKFHVQWCLEL